eukprot:TRINITY_DN1765_c0_g1_i3.p1 TRINITY_DN1765_c0_g1~~TRINITY_DN1765_c0_g1_i3.p1  ORF type:complete len:337 (-),score=101.14 TRINITY_DN1765_c0_g1_i3:58-1068(-)
MEEWCRTLPKIELHAHLNGSIRDEIVERIAKRKCVDLNELAGYRIPDAKTRSLADAFDIFSVIYKLTTDADTVYEITTEVLKDFAEDNVIYLELRTTPRSRPTLSKRCYVETVLRAIGDARVRHPTLDVRLLLSVDRGADTAADALDTVALATEFAAPAGPVVGVDLAGNPYKGQFETYLPAFQAARQAGLRVTLHAAEILVPAETEQILAFRPDRLGHCCCLDERCEAMLQELGIPLELCLTSNVKCQSVSCASDHHFKGHYDRRHPVILCTDDKGVFSTSLSQEYALAAETFNLTRRNLFDLASQAAEHVFADESTKSLLREHFRRAAETLAFD